jgi:plastocyanin domain-containing protein
MLRHLEIFMHIALQSLAVAAAALSFGASLASAEKPASPAADAAGKAQLVKLEVTSEGFVPATVKVRAGRPVKLVVTRKVERTCATEIVISELKIQKPLPVGVPVEVTLTPKKPGAVRFACAMDMIAGTLIVE